MKTTLQTTKSVLLRIIPLAVLCASLASQASAATFVEWTTLDSVNAFGSPGLGRITTNRPPVNPAGCAHDYFYAFDLTTDGGREGYRTALAAFLSGKQVRLDINETRCEGAFPAINVIYLR